MTDAYDSHSMPIDGPIEKTFSITPGGDDLTQVIRGLYVGTSGHVVLVDLNDNEIELKNLAAGVWHPIRCKKVLATATALGSPAPTTTALNIVGGY